MTHISAKAKSATSSLESLVISLAGEVSELRTQVADLLRAKETASVIVRSKVPDSLADYGRVVTCGVPYPSPKDTKLHIRGGLKK